MTGLNVRLPGSAAGLSVRLLLLTIGFVMLAEVLIYTPSIGRFRLSYLEERLAAAHLAILTLDATPDQLVSADLRHELLSHVGAYAIVMTRPGRGKLMLDGTAPYQVTATFDLRQAGFFGLIGDAFAALATDDGRVLRVIGASPKDPAILVDMVMDEAPLRAEMLAFSNRILGLSLVISLITAALVYLSLHWIMVRPMLRITDNITRFSRDPEDETRVIDPSDRRDEIGLVQRELGAMQSALRAALQHKTRLAGVGTAVTKINHDLKNILATAMLLSDRLQQSDDPEVRRVTPRLMDAIERATRLCEQTLTFTREGPVHLERSRFDLGALVDDVGASLPARVNGAATWRNSLSGDLEVTADREQLFRVLTNLGQNAIEAGATRIDVSARRRNGRLEVRLADDGPGLAPRARERLFQPFSGSARPGGTGLGLAISRELMRAHGGEIRLERSTGEGSVFALVLPMDGAEGPEEEGLSPGPESAP